MTGLSTVAARRRWLRHRRSPSHLRNLTSWGAWTVGLVALVTFVGGALMTAR